MLLTWFVQQHIIPIFCPHGDWHDSNVVWIYTLLFRNLFELCGYLPDSQKYFDYAESILRSLSSPEYLAEPGTNCGFILKHSTGSLAHGSEIDVPLNYADYYYLESIKRYMGE